MPKSKRNKQIELAKTKKRGREWKEHLLEEVRSCVDKYTNVFVFSVSDMRNSKMKNVREQWKNSRFFIGKNKIMAMALGRCAEEEYKPNLHKIGKQIRGQRGLLFSNKPVEDVLSWFRSYSEGDYARSGNIATETVNLQAGPLTMFPHNLEPYLRQLGLPTSLVKGVIHLVKDHEVCKEGDVLTPETAKILKLLQYEMAEFHINIDCVWSQDGSFLQLTDSIDSDSKENIKKTKKTSLNIKVGEDILNLPDEEEMEVEVDDESDSKDENDAIEVNTSEENKTELDDEIHSEKNNNGSSQVNIAETNKEELEAKLDDEINSEDENDSSQVKDAEPNREESKAKLDDELHSKDENKSSEANDAEPNKEDCIDIVDDENLSEMNSEPNTEECSAKLDDELNSKDEKDSPNKEDCNSVDESEVQDTDEIAEYRIDVPSSIVNDTEDTKSNKRKSRASTRKSVKEKRVSLPKTPDANTSQDSPVFRQLRNRSVKVNRKRK